MTRTHTTHRKKNIFLDLRKNPRKIKYNRKFSFPTFKKVFKFNKIAGIIRMRGTLYRNK